MRNDDVSCAVEDVQISSAEGFAQGLLASSIETWS
jgi:hypothetical protein